MPYFVLFSNILPSASKCTSFTFHLSVKNSTLEVTILCCFLSSQEIILTCYRISTLLCTEFTDRDAVRLTVLIVVPLCFKRSHKNIYCRSYYSTFTTSLSHWCPLLHPKRYYSSQLSPDKDNKTSSSQLLNKIFKRCSVRTCLIRPFYEITS